MKQKKNRINKKNIYPNIHVYLPPEQYSLVKALADKEERSLTRQVLVLIQRALKEAAHE